MVEAFNGKDCLVKLYIDDTTAGIAPTSWATGVTTIAIATSASVNTSKTITPHHGLNHQTPQVIKQGNITYEFSIDGIYTPDAVEDLDDIQAMVDGTTTFAMYLQANDATATEAMSIELLSCACSAGNVEVSDDGDLTFSLSGQGTTKTVTVA